MRILEDRDLARAVAARDLDRGIERQVAELDGVHLAQPRFGEVLLRVQVDDVAHEQERGVGVGIEHVAARGDLVERAVRNLAHRVDRRFGKLLLQGRLHLVDVLRGRR